MTDQDIPRERDLPAGRFAQMKDDLMTRMDETERAHPTDRPIDLSATRHRRRRAGLAAAAAAIALGVTGVVTLGGSDSASAGPNFAEPIDDGYVRIHIEDLDDPGQVEQDLADLGVPARVDIHEGGGERCDDARSDGWTEPAPGLFPDSYADDPADDMFDFAIDPDALRPGETLALEFFWDEHAGAWVTMFSARMSSSPIGECEVIDDPALVVDAENQIVGG